MNPITIKESRTATDLVVLKSKLESEGISCFMKDELSTQVLNYLQLNTVKLQVDKKDVEKALQIMHGSDDFKKVEAITCPDCGSKDVKMALPLKTRLRIIFYIFKNGLTFTAGAMPKYNMNYKCKSCKNKFENNTD